MSSLPPPEDEPDQVPARTFGDSGIGKELRKANFRRHFLEKMRNKGIDLEELSRQSEIPMATLRRWEKHGVSSAKHEHLKSAARVLGLNDPWAFFASTTPPAEPEAQPRRPLLPPSSTATSKKQELPEGFATHPMIEQARRDRPELFDSLTADEWQELATHRGVGGALTYEGVLHFAEKIQRKREVRRQFEVLLESEHFRTLAEFVGVLYRDIRYR